MNFNDFPGLSKLPLASDVEMSKRIKEADEFLGAVFPDDEDARLQWLSDEATVWDFWKDSNDILIDLCAKHYGIDLSDKLNVPFWQLLDYLKENRTR